MAISKVILNGDTLMDVTSDTVEAGKLLENETATKNDGTKVTGTLVAGEDVPVFKTIYNTLTSQTTITCNKTFEQCAELFNAGDTKVAVLKDYLKQGSKEVKNDLDTPLLCYMDSVDENTTDLVYIDANETYRAPSIEIRYHQNGTITYTYDTSRYTETLTVNRSGNFSPADSLSNFISVEVPQGSATPASSVSATEATVTTGTNTLTLSKSVSNTPQVTAGYVSAGTAGNTSISLTANVTTKAAATITPSTTNQTIASGTYLMGTQTIVGDSNLTAANIAEGVPIFGVTGTHSGKAKHTATITAQGIYDMRSGIYCFVYVTVGQRHYTLGDTFEFSEGDTLKCCLAQYEHRSQVVIYVNGDVVYSDSGSSSTYSYSYDYILPNYDIDIALTTTGASMSITTPTISITENGNYDVADYARANVNATGEYYGIYKALANGYDIITTGSNSYTTQDVQDYCDSLSSIYNNQFVQRNFVPSGITFNNVTTIGSYAFGSVYTNVTSGNYRGSLIYSFPSLLSISSAAFISNKFIKEINAPNCSIIQDATFSNCDFLTTINFPACTSIGPMAFYSCYSLSTANFPVCTLIGPTAFYQCSSLTLANFPVCTSIGRAAFRSCRTLTDLSFPSCVSISDYAFAGCYSLSTANFPACTLISDYTFSICTSLTTISFPNCVSIGDYAFNQCHKIITADFPACTSIGDCAFSACLSLTTISFPVCTSIGTYAFFSCQTLSTANFPQCITINSSAFFGCESLTTVSFPLVTSIGTYAFYGCFNLLSLYLLGSSVPTLASYNAFNSTPISTYTTSTSGVYGSIYVPASLYDSYITATNWSRYSARIVSV